MISLDVVVCSKDRPQNLLSCIPILNGLPHDRIFVFEGSSEPNERVLKFLRRKYGVIVHYCPNEKLGLVRNKAISFSKSDYVAMIDDDVSLCNDWLELLMSEFREGVAAVSSKVVYDDAAGFLKKLCFKNLRGTGESGGAAIYDRVAVLQVGNYDVNVHIGEDMVLRMAIERAGKKWVRSRFAYVLHPITLRDYLNRPKGYAIGWTYVMRYKSGRWLFLMKRVGSLFVMPVYYFFQTLDLRVLGVYFLYKLNALLSFLRLKNRDKV